MIRGPSKALAALMAFGGGVTCLLVLLVNGEINPLDLSGPPFLLFYVGFVPCVLGSMTLVRALVEASDEAPRLALDDPYMIAFLRGGEREVLRTAVIALVDRGLLEPLATTLRVARPDARELVKRDLERALVEHFLSGAEVSSVFESMPLAATCNVYRAHLAERGLVAGDREALARRILLVCALAAILGMGLLKVVVAIGRGHHNIGLLLMLSVAATFAATQLYDPLRTARGDALLEDVRELFDGLRARALTIRRGLGTPELALAVAVFGVDVLPADYFPYAHQIFHKALIEDPGKRSAGSASCGSSCGSSCGGGCGGGCGGCGG